MLEPELPVLPRDVPTAGRGRTARDAELQVHRDGGDGDRGAEPGIEVVPALEAARGRDGYNLSGQFSERVREKKWTPRPSQRKFPPNTPRPAPAVRQTLPA